MDPDVICIDDDDEKEGEVISISDSDDIVYISSVPGTSTKEEQRQIPKVSKNRLRKLRRKARRAAERQLSLEPTSGKEAKSECEMFVDETAVRQQSLEPPSREKAGSDWETCLSEVTRGALRQISERKENFIFLVAGAKNMGKSTFGRCLANKLLEKGLTVYHLECDPGQTEFTPPGCLSLTEVVERVGGLPFTHLRTPVSCKFFGEATPANRMGDYIDCIQRLILDFGHVSARTSPSCLVVNTSGWIHGGGLAALQEICRASKPHHVVLLCPVRPSANSAETTEIARREILWTLSEIAQAPPCRLSFVDGCDTRDDPIFGLTANRVLSAPMLREAALLSYFGHKVSINVSTFDMMRARLSSSVRSGRPYAVPMKDVYVNVVHGVPPPAYILSTLNASLVALCRYENENGGGEMDKHWLDDSSLPKVLEENVSKIQCLGFGVIRAIDVDTRTFYLFTPLSRDKLARVNAFLKGDISLPSAVFKCQQVTRRGCEIPIHLPYLVRGKRSLELDDDHLVLRELDDQGVSRMKRIKEMIREKEKEKKRRMVEQLKEKTRQKKKEKQQRAVERFKEMTRQKKEQEKRPGPVEAGDNSSQSTAGTGQAEERQDQEKQYQRTIVISRLASFPKKSTARQKEQKEKVDQKEKRRMVEQLKETKKQKPSEKTRRRVERVVETLRQKEEEKRLGSMQAGDSSSQSTAGTSQAEKGQDQKEQWRRVLSGYLASFPNTSTARQKEQKEKMNQESETPVMETRKMRRERIEREETARRSMDQIADVEALEAAPSFIPLGCS